MLHKQRIGAWIALVLSFTIPLGCFFVYDQRSIQPKNKWDAKQNSDKIMVEYPIISSIYNNFYRYSDTNNDLQEIKLDQQTDDEVMKITEDFQYELRLLMEKNVLKPSYLDANTIQDYSINYGTLMKNDEKNGKLILTQIYSMDGVYVNDGTFTMDRSTHKITGLFIEHETLKKPSKEEQKTILWQYIRYLGLDTLPDWRYTEDGYESYKARVQVYMDLKKNVGNQQMSILICPLGQYHKNQDNQRIIISG